MPQFDQRDQTVQNQYNADNILKIDFNIDFSNLKGVRSWRIPSPSPFFTGQQAYLAKLEEVLDSGEAGGITQPTGLRGPGGIGKTELALAYAQIYGDRYEAGFFVLADSLIALDVGLARIANPDLSSDAGSDEVERLKHQALREIASKGRVLMILDNVDEIVQTTEFKQVLVALSQADVIVTCRHRQMGAGVSQVEVEKLDEETGALYVLRLAGGGPSWSIDQFPEDDREAATTLSRELDGLPLALHHAGTATQEGVSLAEVLEEYRTNRARILANRGEEAEANHPASAQVMVTLAWEKLAEKNAAAAELVACCAFLSPDEIAEDLFTNQLLELQKPLASAINAFASVRAAAVKSVLIERDEKTSRLSMHRVTQAVLQDDPRIGAEERLKATNKLVFNFLYKGRYREAMVHGEVALARRRSLLGDIDPSTLKSMGNLAETYSAMGRHGEALKIKEETLAGYRTLYGDSRNPDTLRSMSNLATTYSVLGRHGEALKLKEETLASRRSLFGDGNRDTVMSMGNLATTYLTLGRQDEALTLNKEALAGSRSLFQFAYADMLMSMSNLAGTYSAMGHHGEALKLKEEALSGYRSQFEDAHPYTLKSMGNLAGTYSDLGRHGEAVALLEKAVAGYSAKYEPEHPDRKWAEQLLATCRKRANGG